jgi:hypothetical protein
VNAAGRGHFIHEVVELVVVSLAVNVASSAVHDLLWGLVSGIWHDHGPPAGLGLAEARADEADLVTVSRTGGMRS